MASCGENAFREWASRVEACRGRVEVWSRQGRGMIQRFFGAKINLRCKNACFPIEIKPFLYRKASSFIARFFLGSLMIMVDFIVGSLIIVFRVSNMFFFQENW